MKLTKLLHKPVSFSSKLSSLMLRCAGTDCVVCYRELGNLATVIIIKDGKHFRGLISYNRVAFPAKIIKQSLHTFPNLKTALIYVGLDPRTPMINDSFTIVDKKEYKRFQEYYLVEIL